MNEWNTLFNHDKIVNKYFIFLRLLIVHKLHNKLSRSSRDIYLFFFSYEVKYELVVADENSLGKLAKATGMVSTNNVWCLLGVSPAYSTLIVHSYSEEKYSACTKRW